MQRRLTDLTSRTFDLLVVGGGIVGVITACDAAQRGLSVALIERQDFGSGTTFNHLRTLHGGLRYLQHLDFGRALESIAERRTLARIAPWAVAPMPFVLPLGASLMRGRAAMRAGFLLDRIVSRKRNDGLADTHALPAGAVISAAEARQRFPMLSSVPMRAAAVWHDYVAVAADRLTFAWAEAAAHAGATLANYVNAEALRLNNQRHVVVTATDRLSDTTFDIVAQTVVNATGANLDHLIGSLNLRTGMGVTRAMNLVTSLPGGNAALGRTLAGRNFFMVPWQGRALFGTWESGTFEQSDDTFVKASEVDGFIRDLRSAFPDMKISAESVTFVHRGVVPATKRGRGGATLDGREQIHDHAINGLPQIISVAGTKYTTARAVAAKVTDRVLFALRRRPQSSATATTPLPAPPSDRDAVLGRADEEMVVTLEDAVVRRTTIGALGRPSAEELSHAARIVGDRLGWSEHTQSAEIERTLGFYRDRAPRP